MKNKGFEGWYFKHQNGGNMIAFIPGKAKSGAFIQMISTNGSRHFDISNLTVGKEIIRADNCMFTKHGCKINLPGIKGDIHYGKFTSLRSDIMGPFRFFPMECRHGVISMSHRLCGSITVDDKQYCFDNGIGYIEKDSGTSFPSSYLWLQCNSFACPCSVMVSVAQIPFYGLNFKGCICSVIYNNKEYRLATYNGVKIKSSKADYVCLSQGKLMLEIEIKPSSRSYPLFSPVMGKMSGIIHESSNADIHVILREYGKTVFDLHSSNAAYEYFPLNK